MQLFGEKFFQRLFFRFFTPPSKGLFRASAPWRALKPGTHSLQMAYNLINLPAQIDSGSIMKAGYTYLSDGTKARALDASGVGYDYLGSFTYTHDANNNTTLESVSFGGGRVRKNGSGYDVDYYITDHLGSVRAIVNASGTITEQNDYYPFGTRHPNGLTTLSGNRWRFSGKEEQDAAFGVPYSDFGARLYDRTAWTAIDPLAEKYYSVSPYVYCHNNPMNVVDFDGMTDYFSSEGVLLYRDGEDNGVIRVCSNDDLQPIWDYLYACDSHMFSFIVLEKLNYNLKHSSPLLSEAIISGAISHDNALIVYNQYCPLKIQDSSLKIL